MFDFLNPSGADRRLDDFNPQKKLGSLLTLTSCCRDIVKYARILYQISGMISGMISSVRQIETTHSL